MTLKSSKTQKLRIFNAIYFDEFQDLGAEKSDNANSASENEKSGVTGTTHAISAAASISERRNGDPVAFRSDKTKKVQSIMVFYSDNSFEIFKPSEDSIDNKRRPCFSPKDTKPSFE